MKHLFFSIVFGLLLFGLANAQTTPVNIKGIVKDAVTDMPVTNAKISIVGTTTHTFSGSNGAFSLQTDLSGTVILSVDHASYTSTEKSANIAGSDVDLGTITLSEPSGAESVIELSESDIEFADEATNANISGILHGSRDAFMSAAAYSFGPLRFRIRGYDNEYTTLYMNGMATNDLESGRPQWNLWGGLNDAVRNRQSFKGVHANDFGFGDVGGASGINTRASEMRKQTKLTYSYSNRTYTNRAMFIHSTGMMQNGLAVSVSGSRRASIDDVLGGAMESYIDGTFYDAWSYFASIEKKFNDHHSLGFVGFGAPNKRGKSGGSTQEVYDLTGNNYYNPYWGLQDGEVRNSRISNSHKPMGILTHYWQIDNSSSLQTSASYTQGIYSNTSLNWYNAVDPRPDYYRYLPSYMTSQEAIDLRTEEFQNGERQILWENLYATNLSTMDTITNPNNAGGELIGYRSEYIIEERRDDEKQFAFNTLYMNELTDHLSLKVGASYRDYTGSHYKIVNDLLGGDFLLDVDKYAQDQNETTNTTTATLGSADSDIRYPNRVIKVGDRFGYDYDSNIKYAQAWAQLDGTFSKVDFYIASEFNYTNFWRTGNMQNANFPNNSLGDSEAQSFENMGVKAGVVYKITGRHYLKANGIYKTSAPNFRDAYASVRTRDDLVKNVGNEKITSVDVGYVLRSPIFKVSLDAFYTQFEDQVWVRSFYHDGYANFVNYAMTGIDKTHQGMELGAQAELFPGFNLTGVASLGYYRWTSNPEVSVVVDNSAEVIDSEVVYATGYLVDGTPQTALSFGFQYWAPKYWFISSNINYTQDRYLSFNPVRLTPEAVHGIDPGSDLYNAIVEQELLPSAYTIDLGIGKSFRIDRKYTININLNMSNVLDNKEVMTGGYAQLRFDDATKDVEKFDPKYFYYLGRQYFLNISFRY